MEAPPRMTSGLRSRTFVFLLTDFEGEETRNTAMKRAQEFFDIRASYIFVFSRLLKMYSSRTFQIPLETGLKMYSPPF